LFFGEKLSNFVKDEFEKFEKIERVCKGKSYRKIIGSFFRDKNFLFIKKMKGIAKLAFFMIELAYENN